ncbi:MAG TPA: TIGR04552 family protein [Bacteriovoracaceae bacterium]|nr:TIGR04552 family protein [Bacteriovoracaceae bacterium]
MGSRPEYLQEYAFNWETFDMICSGKSSLEGTSYLKDLVTKEDVASFLIGYGFDISDPVENAELFGIFQEAIQFIRRYFLKEGNPEGLDLRLPNFLFSITNVSDLFLAANGKSLGFKLNTEEAIWASVVLKVMHTILHADKDLRYRYFSTIQQQIFDRFYKFIHRDSDNNLFFKNDCGTSIPLVDFQTKAKKTRDSIIIKLLHKKENVAEELFDRIGVRIVTKNKLDTLRIIRFLVTNNIITVNNIKPSRSQNTLINLAELRIKMFSIYKAAIREKWAEEVFYNNLNKLIDECVPVSKHSNDHSFDEYRAIHFTGRQLIKYKNPFMSSFNEIRKKALSDKEHPLSQALLSIDTTPISRDVRFFYPFEVQITDADSHVRNTQGEASHEEYKKSQVRSAMKRIFKQLIELKNLNLD